MTEASPSKPEAIDPPAMSFKTFLEQSPPNAPATIADLWTYVRRHNRDFRDLETPDLHLHCSDENCQGERTYRFLRGEISLGEAGTRLNTFVTWRCSNCQNTLKLFAINVERTGPDFQGICQKFGEIPTFGPITPPKLFKRLGKHRSTFIKGRRCEAQALGVGAFVYYRRIVEELRDGLMEEVITLSKKLNAPSEKIVLLEQARKETQFKKSLEMIKDAIPQVLLINGHNPFTLLHSALSDGVHNLTDEDCLELAQTIRLVLFDLIERLSLAVKEEAELSGAISRLLNR